MKIIRLGDPDFALGTPEFPPARPRCRFWVRGGLTPDSPLTVGYRFPICVDELILIFLVIRVLFI